MMIDCDACRAPASACGDCVMTVLVGARAGRVELDGPERTALAVLASAGLAPPLRLVTPLTPDDDDIDSTARRLAGGWYGVA